MDVAVEDMTAADLEAVLAIDLAGGGHATPAGEDPRASRARHFTEELARPWARLRVARAPGGGVVGYLLSWRVVDEIHLLDVVVDTAARRRGVGRALLGDLFAYARAHAAAKVLLEVRASNAAAIALYERLGFARLGVRQRYYADGEDAIEMMAEL